ncbi:hypothetical protein [Zhihengliuella sp.]|uniref:hypothetical protein n=1 Tax=Zhihengliuella sp. TaxID=1954483 RepID=UPI0028125116|nr:hypothetical protein [Zhihengliuella sp.]
MTINIRELLHRVVAEVFDGEPVTWQDLASDSSHMHGLQLSAHAGPDGRVRRAELRATYEWFDARILDLDVGAILFDYGDDEEEKADEIRELAHLVLAYLRAEAQITYRPSLIRRRPVPTLTIETSARRWRLRRSTFTFTEH